MDSLAPGTAARIFSDRIARPVGIRTFRNVLIVAVAYYVGAEIAFLIGTLSDKIFAPFWPPNTILFCALLLTPTSRWWLILAAVIPAHIIVELRVGMPPVQLVVAFATNAMCALITTSAPAAIPARNGTSSIESRRA